MKNNPPILSILITTYNRVKFLETTASLFISQIISGGLADKVEIIIGNDASSDGTHDYLNHLQSSHKFIKVINHPADLGLSGNLEALIAMARGEYIWPFGDDDLITGGAISRVLQSIAAGRPNYLIINTKNIMSLDDSNKKYEVMGDKRLAINEDIFIGNFQKEFRKLLKIKNWLYLTNLISAVVFKKKLFLDWIGVAKKRVRGENVYLFQAPLIMGIAKEGGLNLIAEPLVLHRKNENNWSKSAEEILRVNLYDAGEISDIIKEYLPDEYAQYKKRFAAHVFGTVLSAKKGGINMNKHIISAIKMNYDCYPYNFRFLAVLLVPGIILKHFI